MKDVERLFEPTPVLPAEAIVGSDIPSFERGRELGLFVVYDGEICQLQWTGDARVTNKRNVVEMEVTTDGPLSLLGTDSWDYTDHVLEVTDSHFRAKALVDVGTDGVDLSLHDAAVARFDLGVSGDVPMDVDETMSEAELVRYTRTKATSRRPGVVHLGADGTTPDHLPVTVWLDRELLEQKLGLAESVTELAGSIDVEARTELALETLLEAVHDGAVEPKVAVNAIERLILGENVTQATLAAIGPAGNDGTVEVDDYDRLGLDTPENIEQLDVAGELIEAAVSLLIGLVTMEVVLKKLQVVTDIPYVGSAITKIDGHIQRFIESLPESVRTDLPAFVDDTVEELFEDLIEDAWELLGLPEELLDELDDYVDWLEEPFEDAAEWVWENVEAVLGYLDWEEGIPEAGRSLEEKGATSAITGAIEDTQAALSETVVGFAEPSFDADLEALYAGVAEGGSGGSLDGAVSAAQDGVERIHSLAESMSEWAEDLELLTSVTEWVGMAVVVVAVLVAAPYFAGIAAAIAGGLSLLFPLVKGFISTMDVTAITDVHGRALEGVQNA